MNLYPEDLGEKRQRQLFARRAHYHPGLAPVRIGGWGRHWMGRAHRDTLAPETAAPVLHAVRRHSAFVSTALGLVSAPLAIAILGNIGPQDPPAALGALTLLGGGTWLMGVFYPQRVFDRAFQRIARDPLSAAEVAGLLPQAVDELERAYLTLIMDVARQEVSPGAAEELRSALRALGQAIDKLPASRVVADSPDILTEVLRRTAAQTLTQSQAEADRVVAASLVRQAEALHRRADATHRANLLVRRFGALRQEMAAETEALRAGLSAYYTGPNDIADLTRLAEDVRRVAAEAAAVTAAVEEVDHLLAGPVTTPAQASPQARLGLGPG